MKVVVHDACVLINLLRAELVKLWKNTEIEIHTTELAIWEVIEDLRPLHESGSLHVTQTSAEGLIALLEFKKSHNTLSLEDCSVLCLAHASNAPLLTGDKELRAIAEREGVRVHGMLWILDYLIEQEQISPRQAVEALRALHQHGSRFSKDEVDARFDNWSKLTPACQRRVTR